MNALPEKRCSRCGYWMPLSYFAERTDRPGKHCSRCRDCDNAARRRSTSKAVERPVWVPPVDFLSMGEADRGACLRWTL